MGLGFKKHSQKKKATKNIASSLNLIKDLENIYIYIHIHMSIQAQWQVLHPPSGAHGYMYQWPILKTQSIIFLLFNQFPSQKPG